MSICSYCGIEGDRSGNCDRPPIIEDYEQSCDQYERAHKVKEPLRERLERLGLKTWDKTIRQEGDIYVLIWGDYFEPEPYIKRNFIEKNCIESNRFDNTFIATFVAVLSEDQKNLIVSAYGEDVATWEGTKTVTTTVTRL